MFTIKTTLAIIAATAALSFGVTAPDLPMTGWATQNGGTTGGKGYGEVTVSSTADLKKYAEAGNKIIYVKPGTYAGPINVASNVTIYGYQGAVITQPTSGSAIKLSGSKNVIIRNLKLQGVGAKDDDDEDCLQVNNQSKNVWIDHVDVYDGHDGNLDITNASDYVTLSWVKFSYTSKSSNHQFSNLIGNSDSKTGDANALKVTLHHTWWADGVVERMPRVRFGQVHVVNNLFDSKTASYCVRAGMKANIRVENNVFIGVKRPLDYNNQSKEDAKVSMIGNYFENTSGNTTGQGTAFTPAYSMKATDVSNKDKAYALRDSIKMYAGATLPNPGNGGSVTPVSSSSKPVSSSATQPASSSSVKSSSSQTPVSSSSIVSGVVSFTKHGSGSATQTVAQGQAIVDFYYTITGANSAIVSGLPEGVVGKWDGSNFTISGTVSSTAAVGDYKFTVTAENGTDRASKNGTITVTASGNGGNEPASSSAMAPASSSDIKPTSSAASSSSQTNSDAASSAEEPHESSSSQTEAIVSGAPTPSLHITVNGRSLNIENVIGRTVHVFDLHGKQISSQCVGTLNYEITLPRAGSYLVRVGDHTQRVNVK